MIGRLILLLAFVILAAAIIKQCRKLPREQLRQQYWKLGLTVLAIVLVLLALTGRIHWLFAAVGALLPVLKTLALTTWRYFPLLQQAQKFRQRGAASQNQRAQASTSILAMHVEGAERRLSGEVISGPYAGMQLAAMSLDQLRALLAYCNQRDSDSSRLLITYLQQRFGQDWQQQPGTSNNSLDEEAALAILGLETHATRQDVIQAHRRLMSKVHPDRGGSDYLAAQINAAKELLLKTR